MNEKMVTVNQEMQGIRLEKYTMEWLNTHFPIVYASTITSSSRMLQHKPRNKEQEALKLILQKIAQKGMPDFRAQAMDPYVSLDGQIIYGKGYEAEVRKSPKWWEGEFRNFLPEMNSQMGTYLQYCAFLGMQIEQLVEEYGYKLRRAWYEVCNNSSKIANCWDSQRFWNQNGAMEPTGSRPIGRWYDLGNTRKITIDDQRAYYRSCGSSFATEGASHPLTFSAVFADDNKPDYASTGWCVMDVSPVK